MGVLKEILVEELVDLSCDSKSKEEFFVNKADELNALGFVKDSFLEAIISREEEYPTGLALESITIAIPHTMTEHVNYPFVYINKLTQPEISFVQMGTDDVMVRPTFILILGIKNPKEQVKLLAELMDLFNTPDFVDELVNVKEDKKLIELISKYTK